jgi:hypothetical protein
VTGLSDRLLRPKKNSFEEQLEALPLEALPPDVIESGSFTGTEGH